MSKYLQSYALCLRLLVCLWDNKKFECGRTAEELKCGKTSSYIRATSCTSYGEECFKVLIYMRLEKTTSGHFPEMVFNNFVNSKKWKMEMSW